MTNTHVFETKFSKRMQATFYNIPTFRALANFEERANLTNGQSVTRPRKSLMVASDYTRGTDSTAQTLEDVAETLSVTSAKISTFSIDDFDAIQSNYKLQNEYADDAAKTVADIMDADFYNQYQYATSTVTAEDFGGSSALGVTLSTSNVLSVLFKSTQKLRQQNVDITGKFNMNDKLVGMGFAGVSPQFLNALEEYDAGRETVGGDTTFSNGYVRTKAGLDIYATNNLSWSGILGLATTPTDGDTIVIDGVTFTFKTTLGSTAGNVLIGGSADVARANLVGLINAPSTTDSNGVAVSSTRANNYTLSDAEKISRITATNDNTANTASLIAKGVSYITVSETLTDTTDAWTSLIQHNLIGRKKAVDMVIQKDLNVKVSDIPLQLGVYVKPNALYGIKTFNEGARQLVDVQINTSAW